jgi:hypothetical protein
MKRKILCCALLGMVLVAGGVTMVRHYSFSHENAVCVRYETRTVTTYPNQAFTAYGPAYQALALKQAQHNEDVCVAWEDVSNL